MKLRINNIFYSLQGEGRNTGRAAVFVRFAGCNMHCDFCDTDFSRFTEMTAADVVNTIADYPCRFVVLTGGEPTLQVDEAFVDILHSHGYEVAMESNGSMPAPRNIDWLTVSPKEWWKTEGEWWMENIDRINELKVVFDEDTPSRLSTLHLQPSTLHRYLQPCDTGDAQRNADITQRCVEYIKQHPEWRLSLQTHKYINIE